eukprot:m.220858 g.220858  ORF g.220858 m.220858 type:complete len:484 (+) comp39950_c1_seq3:3-1454(+)
MPCVNMLLAFAFVFLSTLILLAVREQLHLRELGRGLAGPKWVLPYVGTLVPIVRDFHDFLVEAFKRARANVSWDYFMGQFMLFTNDISLTKEVLKGQGDEYGVLLSPTCKHLFGARTILFLRKEDHVVIRRVLGCIFSRKGVATFLPIMEKNIRNHLRLWIDACEQDKTIVVASRASDMLLASNVETFLGSQHGMNPFWKEKYTIMAKGFFAAPVYFPGTAYWRAIGAKESLTKRLQPVVKNAIERAKAGKDSNSVIEHWVKSLIETKHTRLEDSEIQQIVEDNLVAFLFASLDTTAAAISSLFARLSAHPDIMAKLRKEQLQLRPNSDPVTAETLREMTYTTQVVKEVLRLDSPILTTMAVAERDTELRGITVKKGTAVAGSLRAALLDGFAEPQKFDPERFGPERREHVLNAKNYIPFGVGPHRCPGNNLAEIFTVLTAAIAATSADWRRIQTKVGDRLVAKPSVRLADGCVIAITTKERM